MMIPAAIRKPFVDIPKNLNRNCPQNVNAINMMKDMIVALFTMCLRSFSSRPLVMVRNTGIVPSGLVNVKNDVKHNKAKGIIASSII